LFDADITEIIETGNLHTHAENFVTRGRYCQLQGEIGAWGGVAW
jgi:hypothetical protein